jgi:hypothetical protein
MRNGLAVMLALLLAVCSACEDTSRQEAAIRSKFGVTQDELHTLVRHWINNFPELSRVQILDLVIEGLEWSLTAGDVLEVVRDLREHCDLRRVTGEEEILSKARAYLKIEARAKADRAKSRSWCERAMAECRGEASWVHFRRTEEECAEKAEVCRPYFADPATDSR